MESIYTKYLACGGRVTTDSRKVGAGEMFFALKGENFDGNLFALQALQQGAAWAVVNEESDAAKSGDERIIAVPDTLKALSELALMHRRRCLGGQHLPVIGLTGTNGKTTTKELIRSVLAKKYNVVATEGNLNNDIGVPLTLLRLREDTDLAVVEMGANHPDDIEKLVKVCEPDYGLITNVGKAHLLGFGSFEGVKQAKGALYRYLNVDGGVAFVNDDDPDLCEMCDEMLRLNIQPYGMTYTGTSVLPSDDEHPFLRLAVGGRTVNTHLVGNYNANNVLAAFAVGKFFDVPFVDAVEAIEEFVPKNNRSQMMKTERNTLIVDAYNANPSSMAVALDNFASVGAERKIALLGDMRELGAESVQEHVAVLEKIKSLGVDAYLVGEEFGKALECADVAVLGHFPDSSALAEHLAAAAYEGVCFLVKGSRGIMMEKVLPSL